MINYEHIKGSEKMKESLLVEQMINYEHIKGSGKMNESLVVEQISPQVTSPFPADRMAAL